MKNELLQQTTVKIQQGDVLVRKINELPKDAKKIKGNIVTESTHPHTISNGELFKLDDMLFVKTNKGVLQHETHAPITLDSGVYWIDRVVEVGMFSDMVSPVVD